MNTNTTTTIKKSTIFTTRDGQKFENMQEAQLHEASLDLLSVFIKEGFINDGGVKSVCMALATHYDKYSAALARLKDKAQRVQKTKTNK